MIIRKANERGHNTISWLDSYHTFSFGHFYDPKWTNFNQLLVINDDTIAPGMGFGTHPHRDMEIITYVTDGELRHQDSMGSLGIITPGEIQVMSAGTGIAHSEYNHQSDTPVHLFQIWVHPKAKNLKPRYDQKRVFSPEEMNFIKVIAAPDESDNVPVTLNADAQFWLGRYNRSETLIFAPRKFSQYWLQMVKGSLTINGQTFSTGDGAGFIDSERIELKMNDDGAEFLIIEVGKLN